MNVSSSVSPAQRAVIAAALVAFVALRLWQCLAFSPRMSDTGVYFKYVAQTVDFGKSAFRQVPMEYPPVAYWAMALPRVLDPWHRITPETLHDEDHKKHSLAAYATGYRLFMFALEGVGLWGLLAVVRRRRPEALAWAVVTYVAASTLLAHVLLDRLDMGLWAMIALWAYLRQRGEEPGATDLLSKISYLLLGLSVSYKLVTLLVLPFVLLADWRQSGRNTSATAAGKLLVWFAAGVLVPFLVHFPFAGTTSFQFLTFHGERQIEIESTYASLQMLLAPLGLAIATRDTHGSIDLVSAISPALAQGSLLLLLAVLGAAGLIAWRSGRAFGAAAGTRFGLWALLATLACSKVLSAQFFVFALPIAIVLAAELFDQRSRLVVSACCIAIAALTTCVFPYLWYSTTAGGTPWGLVPGLHPLPCALLVVRNALFVALTAWLAWGSLRVWHPPTAMASS